MDTYARSERSSRPHRFTCLPVAREGRAGGEHGGSAVRETPRNVLVVSCCSLYVSHAKLCAIVQARQDPDSALGAVQDCNSGERVLINSQKSRMEPAPAASLRGWTRFALCSLQIAHAGVGSHHIPRPVFRGDLHVEEC